MQNEVHEAPIQCSPKYLGMSSCYSFKNQYCKKLLIYVNDPLYKILNLVAYITWYKMLMLADFMKKIFRNMKHD